LPDPTGQPQFERLPREFFNRPSTEVGPDLLGCVLWHDSPAGLVAVRLVEVEAYQGSSDPASHAYRGQTQRNSVMFGPPGHVYVYFTYGMYFCANLVCQPAGQAEAVLLRAGEVIAGISVAAHRRAGQEQGQNGAGEDGRRLRQLDLARGPARLCQALAIDRSLDGADVCGPGSPLGVGPAPGNGSRAAAIRTGPRVGVSQAADRPWRYWLAGDGHVSVYRPAKPRATRQKPVPGGSTGDGTMQR